MPLSAFQQEVGSDGIVSLGSDGREGALSSPLTVCYDSTLMLELRLDGAIVDELIHAPALALGGVNDYGEAERKRDVLANVGRAFASATNGEFRILLEHRPTHARTHLAANGIDLQLSGHTHGGIGPVVSSLVARLNGGFVRGLYRIGGGVLYVSPGTGQWAGFPMRFFNPSEITLIVLRRRPATESGPNPSDG